MQVRLYRSGEREEEEEVEILLVREHPAAQTSHQSATQRAAPHLNKQPPEPTSPRPSISLVVV